MNLIKDRSCGELVLFAMGALGVYLSIWAVILVSATLECLSFILLLLSVVIFALRDNT